MTNTMTQTDSGLIMPDKRLAVPEHVAAAQRASQNVDIDREKTWEEDGLTEADVPKPSGWRILIEPIEVKSKTRGGLDLPDSVLEAQEYMRYVGHVVSLGPEAYRHRKFGEGGAWCTPGDWVIYGRYAGQEMLIRGETRIHTFRFVNDDEILGITESPEKLIIYAGIA